MDLLQANNGSSSRDCILLQTGLDKTGRFQEAVGEAIAKGFKVGRLGQMSGSMCLPNTLLFMLISDSSQTWHTYFAGKPAGSG